MSVTASLPHVAECTLAALTGAPSSPQADLKKRLESMLRKVDVELIEFIIKAEKTLKDATAKADEYRDAAEPERPKLRYKLTDAKADLEGLLAEITSWLAMHPVRRRPH